MTINVVYVSIDSVQEGVGYSQIVNLLKHISKSDINLKLVSFEKNSKNIGKISTLFAKMNIEWKFYKFDYSLIGVIKRFFIIRKEIKGFDIIHARGDFPVFASLFMRKSKLLWDVRGLWPEQRIVIDSNVFKKIVFKILIRFRFLFLKKIDAISFLSKELEEYFIGNYNVEKKIRVVIPTCVDLNHFKFFKNKLADNTIKIILSGTYNNYYDLDSTEKIIKELQKSNNVEIIWLKPSESNSTIRFIDTSREVSYEQLPNELSNGSFGIALCINDEKSLKGVMPTKIAEFLAVGTPVLVNSNMGDYGVWLKEYRAGVIIETKNIITNLEHYCKLIVDMTNDKKTGSRCRKLAEDKLDIVKAAEQYLKVYEQLRF